MTESFYIKSVTGNIFSGGYGALASTFAKLYSANASQSPTDANVLAGLSKNSPAVDYSAYTNSYGNIDVASLTEAFLASLSTQSSSSGINQAQYQELFQMQGSLQTASSLLTTGKTALTSMLTTLNSMSSAVNSLTANNRGAVQETINNLVQNLFFNKNAAIFGDANIFGPTLDSVKLQSATSNVITQYTPPTINSNSTTTVQKTQNDITVNASEKVTEAEALAQGYTVIKTAAQLQAIATNGTNNANAKYILMNDIDLSSISNFNAIGTDSSSVFSGTFDGNGYTISNLTMDKTASNQGLFGQASGATIKNVTLENVNVKSTGSNTGGLVGYANNSTTISNCSVSGTVTGTSSYTGGLVGYASGRNTISNSFTSGSVNGEHGTGGLVGYANENGAITNCYSSANVTGTRDGSGGLVGFLYSNATISNSYSTGNVTGTSRTGGFLGEANSGSSVISNCYSTGNVSAASGATSTSTFGGFIGVASNSGGTITNCYSTGQILATIGNGGGFAGSVGVTLTSSNNRFVTQANGLAAVGSGSATGITQQASTYFTSALNKSTLSTGAGEAQWNFIGSTPKLAWQPAEKTTRLTESEAIAQGYTVIKTVAQLQAIATNGLNNSNAKYILMADINLSSVSNWQAIGTGSSNAFKGTFDGNGYAISNLTINNSAGYQGLFGYTDGATVKNVDLKNVNISGSNDTAALIGGANNTTVSNCSSSGAITGSASGVGGLLGRTYGTFTITDSFSSANVTCTNGSWTGGIIGDTNGYTEITNCYATGNIQGSGAVGGIVGWLSYDSKINNSYSTGNVTGTGSTGGIIGSLSGSATIANSWASSNIYSTGSPSGGFGGLVGSVGDTLTAINCYSTGQVLATGGTRGGLVGSGTVIATNCSYVTQTNGYSAVGSGSYNGSIAARASNWFTTANIKATLDNGTGTGQWDFSSTTPTLAKPTSGPISETWATTHGYTVIKTAAQLQAISSSSMSGKYILMNDINLSSISNFSAIGTSSSAFTGTFEGNGYTISNLKISSSADYQGLFGYANGATIQDVKLTNVNVSSTGSYIGGLVGHAGNSSNISNCSVSGNVTGGSNYIGGLVGSGFGMTISNSSSTANVSTNAGYTYGMGGLAGYIGGTVTNSYATGNVTGGDRAGGLIGYFESGTVTKSYSTGNVVGTSEVGAFIGHLCSGGITISDSWTSGNATGTDQTGGFIGSTDGGTVSITNCFSSGQNLSTGGTRGAFLGSAYGDITLNNYAYATQKTSGVTGGAGVGTGTVAGTLQTSGKEQIWFWENDRKMIAGSKFTSLAKYDSSSSNQVLWEKQALSMGYTVIKSEADFKAMMNDTNTQGKKYILMCDIDISKVSGFTSIGTTSNPFKGELNGNGFTIKNLNINSSSDNIGLFGRTEGATIKNLTLEGTSIKGKDNVGALIGYANNTTVENVGSNIKVDGASNVGGLIGNANNTNVSLSFTTKNVTGTNANVGGLIGNAYNTNVSQSYAMGATTGLDYVGGLIGAGSGTIKNSYATGKIEGKYAVGGLAGNFSGNINNSYAYGDITAKTNASSVGGFVGMYSGGTITNSYSVGKIDGATTGGGIANFVGSNSGTIGANTYCQAQSGLSSVGGGATGSVVAKDISWFNTASNLTNVLNTGEGAGLWKTVSNTKGGFNATLNNINNNNLSQHLAGETLITGVQGGEVINQVVFGNLANGNYYDGYSAKLLPTGSNFTIDLSLDFGNFGKTDYIDVMSGTDINAVKTANLAKIDALTKLVNDKLALFSDKANDLSIIDTQQKNAISGLGTQQASPSTISPLALLTFADSLQQLVQAQMDQYIGGLGSLLNLGSFPLNLLSGATAGGSGLSKNSTNTGTLSKNSTTYYKY